MWMQVSTLVLVTNMQNNYAAFILYTDLSYIFFNLTVKTALKFVDFEEVVEKNKLGSFYC